MSNLNIHIGQWPILINVIGRFINALLFLCILIPLVIKETNVKNGLRSLRVEMFFTTLIIFLLNSIGLIVIVQRWLGMDVSSTVEMIGYFSTVGFFIYVLLKIKIYTQNYSPENKERHEIIDRIERGESKEVKNK